MGCNKGRKSVLVFLVMPLIFSIYDRIFQAWDGLGKGYIGGDTAIQVFRQSGLPRQDLERIWYALAMSGSLQDSFGSR